MKKIQFLFAVIALFSFKTYCQDKNLYAGIEIGSKGIKMSVLDVDNIKKGDYTVKSFWTENIGIAKGIAKTGKLADEDMNIAAEVVKTNLDKIVKDFNVPLENIFIVGSSGVAMATNTDELTNKVKSKTNKVLEFITVQMEGKLLLRGCVPPINYNNALVLDIGGGNTKGGYVDIYNNDNFVFFPISLNYGSVTLTEAIKQKTKTEDLNEFLVKSFSLMPTLRDQIKKMYNSRPSALNKNMIYMSGGAAWAFYTLYKGSAKQPFNEFSLEDVINYDAMIKNNFSHFEELAKTDEEVNRVLKTYSQKYLISGSNLLLVSLEDIPSISEKKLYFAKEGQIAWLVSYIADRTKKVKKIW
jgi:exopolyphosphatase/pppGpp-phosphohydrolase